MFLSFFIIKTSSPKNHQNNLVMTCRHSFWWELKNDYSFVASFFEWFQTKSLLVSNYSIPLDSSKSWKHCQMYLKLFFVFQKAYCIFFILFLRSCSRIIYDVTSLQKQTNKPKICPPAKILSKKRFFVSKLNQIFRIIIKGFLDVSKLLKLESKTK